MNAYVVGRFPPPYDGQSLSTERLATLLETNARVYRINTEPPSAAHVLAETKFRFKRLWFYVIGARSLRRALRLRPEAPVLWCAVSPTFLGHLRDVLVTLPSIGMRQPVIAVMHRATMHERFISRLTAFTAGMVVRQVDTWVFLTEGLSDRVSDWIPPERRRVIPNTISEEMMPSEAELQERRSGVMRLPFRLLFLGSMMPEKGYETVVDAVALLLARNLDCEAIFAGGWLSHADRERFEQRILAEGLGGAIKHRGALTDRNEIRSLYLSADAFVLPSYHPTEAQPISIIEALATGTPVITTRQGGIPEMIDDGREGFLVPPKSPVDIADALEALLDRKQWLRMSIAARQRFDREFHPEAVRTKWINLIEQVSHSHREA